MSSGRRPNIAHRERRGHFVRFHAISRTTRRRGELGGVPGQEALELGLGVGHAAGLSGAAHRIPGSSAAMWLRSSGALLVSCSAWRASSASTKRRAAACSAERGGTRRHSGWPSPRYSP